MYVCVPQPLPAEQQCVVFVQECHRYTHTHARAHCVQVGLACVNDGAATPKYCLKEFFTSLNRHAKKVS